jgi:hypothetical protein
MKCDKNCNLFIITAQINKNIDAETNIIEIFRSK